MERGFAEVSQEARYRSEKNFVELSN